MGDDISFGVKFLAEIGVKFFELELILRMELKLHLELNSSDGVKMGVNWERFANPHNA